MDLENLKSELEALIRAGRAHQARLRLAQLDASKLPRSEYARFANFARRAGAARWALRLLHPVVRPQDHGLKPGQPPSLGEWSSYALALAASGAVSEAAKIVEKLQSADVPEALLTCAYVSIWNWDYARAVRFLKRYLTRPGLSEFQIALAKLNLASSHEFEGHTAKARALTEELLPLAGGRQWRLIERDALLLAGELGMRRADWGDARRRFREALAVSEGAGLDPILAEKWLAILDIHEFPGDAASFTRLETLKAKAIGLHKWEVSRDCDFHSACVRRDGEILNRLYYGTYFGSFRRRLIRDTREFWTPPNHYLWRPAPGSGGTVVDVSMGEFRQGGRSEKLENDMRLRLFQILTLDLYRPFKIGGLFLELYPDKHFDVINSSQTVANVIQRLRGLFRERGWGMDVECVDRLYRLSVRGDFTFILSDSRVQNLDSLAPYRERLALLKRHWPYQVFSAKQAARTLAIPLAESRKLLRRASQERDVLALGRTSSRLYRFDTGIKKAA